MKKIYLLVMVFFYLNSFAQSSNQNPNHKKAFLEYSKNYKALTNLQGATLQETYEARDDIEFREKERKERRYWRNLERLAGHLCPKVYFNSWELDNRWKRNSIGEDWNWLYNEYSRWNINRDLNFWW